MPRFIPQNYWFFLFGGWFHEKILKIFVFACLVKGRLLLVVVVARESGEGRVKRQLMYVNIAVGKLFRGFRE